MARGKFNKRGGGKRVDAISEQEIEQRNQRLAEFEEERAKRRAEAEEEEEGGEGGDDDATEEAGNAKAEKPKEPEKVTSEAEHRRNLAKLQAVKKRREEAEKKRLEQEEMEKQAEAENKAKAAAITEDDSDSDDDGKKKKKKSTKADIPKLSKIEIKKMKPALLKEALKERGLDIQGNAKVLTQRLIDYEESR